MASSSANSCMNTPLLDSIRRTIEERNLFTARSRIKYVSALKNAGGNNSIRNNAANTVEGRVEKLKSKVVQELMSSEKAYLKQVGLIVDEFKMALEVQGVMLRKDMDVIFGNIELIKTLNEELHKELKATTVSQAFQKFAPMLKIYSAYARNYQQAIQTLQSVQSTESPSATIIKEKEEALGTKLASLLITPIQRIPRYKLLLEHLLSFSKGDANQELQGSLETINEVAQHMNEMVRSFENQQKILEIQSYFKKNMKLELVQPGRILIKHGIVLKPPKNHQRYVILFNDQFYFCKMKMGSKMKLFSPLVVPLRKCVVNLIGNNIMLHFQAETPVMFTVSDPDELVEWHGIIADTLRNLRRRIATLRKESSKGRPMRLGRENARSNTSTPQSRGHDTPGKLKRCLNISSRLDEIINYLSPKRKRLEPPKATSSIHGT